MLCLSTFSGPRDLSVQTFRQPDDNPRRGVPGSKVMENVRFGGIGALSQTLAAYAASRPLLPGPPGLVPGP